MTIINNSKYHMQVSFVTDINDTYAICNYGLIIREKDEGILEYFDPKPKDSSRWFRDITYGQIGCKGVFE